MTNSGNKVCPKCGGIATLMTSDRSTGTKYVCYECMYRFGVKQIDLGEFQHE